MTPGPLRFEGREVQVLEGDTVASAMFRAGVRTFSRSLKAHRRRGLYCGTGECPNCSVTVDGVPGVQSCITPAAADMRVERVDEPTVFGFTWHIYGLAEDDPRRTYVEFTLEPVGAGTRLTVVESGFDQLPVARRDLAFRMNEGGWAAQITNIDRYATGKAGVSN